MKKTLSMKKMFTQGSFAAPGLRVPAVVLTLALGAFALGGPAGADVSPDGGGGQHGFAAKLACWEDCFQRFFDKLNQCGGLPEPGQEYCYEGAADFFYECMGECSG